MAIINFEIRYRPGKKNLVDVLSRRLDYAQDEPRLTAPLLILATSNQDIETLLLYKGRVLLLHLIIEKAIEVFIEGYESLLVSLYELKQRSRTVILYSAIEINPYNDDNLFNDLVS